jgi:hypothetical protein
MKMDKLIIQIISISSKIANFLAIHCQVVTQCAKHQNVILQKQNLDYDGAIYFFFVTTTWFKRNIKGGYRELKAVVCNFTTHWGDGPSTMSGQRSVRKTEPFNN